MPKPYTIITTIYTIGQIIKPCEKEEVRKQCENMRKLHNVQIENEHLIIEVVNNETNEIREYYNSKDNKIKF